MPQLEIQSYPSQIFWLIVCFFSMYFIMAQIIIPKIADIMEQRRQKIDSALEKAMTIKQQAEKSLQKYEDALAKATAEAEKSLNKTQDELNRMVAEKQAELEKELKAKIEAGEEQIRQSKEAALKEVKTTSEKLALEVTQKLGIKEINAANIKAAFKKVEGQ